MGGHWLFGFGCTWCLSGFLLLGVVWDGLVVLVLVGVSVLTCLLCRFWLSGFRGFM